MTKKPLYLKTSLLIQVNPYLIDAIIGFSVVYKGFDKLAGFKRLWVNNPALSSRY